MLEVKERFRSKVNQNGSVPIHRPDLGPCWVWCGGVDQDGYGVFYASRFDKRKAHRYAYEITIGAIADGLVTDHLCLNKSCVNPSHVEMVTSAENTRRHHALTTSCVQGHPYDEQNTGYSQGRRRCLACHRQRTRERRERHRAAI